MSVLENKIASLSSRVAGLILVLAPFWAFITVWPASNFGHYTILRLVIEVLLVLIILGAASLLVIDKKLAAKLIQQKWFWPFAAIIILEIIWGIVSYLNDSVSLKALGYAWIIDLRFLLFFAGVFVIASCDNWLKNNWKKLIIIPAVVVAAFAVLQFAVLPLDFLTHFGYGPHTIFPYQTINHNHNYPRAMSFTRGANPLGAYLLIVVTLLAAYFTKNKSKLWKIGGLILTLAALAFSFSRSAWLGAIISLILLGWLVLESAKARKIVLAAGGAVAIICLIIFLGFRDNPHLQSYFLHTQTQSVIKTNSNEGHLSALENGFKNVIKDPLGDGPGTSGPASLYNSEAPARNTENYYLQIGEENGWLGLLLMLAFFVLAAIELLRRKTKLALGLFASFVGLAVVNFLLPAWTDVTLAYIFWGLAGLALSFSSRERN